MNTRNILKFDECFVRTVKQYAESNYDYDTFFRGTMFKASDVKWAIKNKIWELPENKKYFD